MGCGGNPHVVVWFLGILGNPLNETQASRIGQFFFCTLFPKRMQFQHNAPRPHYLSFQTKTGQMTQGILTKGLIYYCVFGGNRYTQ